MFGRAWRSSSRLSEPERHASVLETLTCHICGTGPFVECDLTAHQEYANARFSCTVCGAAAGEVCEYDCPAADALQKVLVGVTPDYAMSTLAAWAW